ncbi:MAG: hypothetical protein M5U27_06410 [Gaiella sp.]|nr:hypothetical protein [Gaiella sp.]
MRRSIALLGLTLILAVVAAFAATPAMANGCTPGFWKNRAVKLELYNEEATVASVFASAPASVAGDSLLEALSYGGGSTLLAKQKILLRAAVAGWLNYTVQGPGVYWTQFSGAFGADGEQYTVAEYVGLVNSALLSTSESDILLLASHIDIKNNEHAADSICS